MKKYILLFFILVTLSINLFAQKGTLTGIVVDQDSGEALFGANLYIPVLGEGGVTDLTGKYNIQLDPGVYRIEVSFITHQKKIIEDVEVFIGRVTVLDIALSENSQELEEVIVSARRMDNNEVSLLRLQKRSLPVQDGISAEEIGRIGFSNSAESMRQVTGASVEGGSYIIMRGLGDRYSISSMDGVVLPATNPYRNSASLDLIPASMVDNIVVKKTFSPDLPGNFSGGAVDITTKSLPDRLYFKISTSASYNDQTTFNSNFLRDPVSNNYRRLGFDDGKRGLNNDWSNNDFLNNLNRYLISIQNNQLNESEIASFNSTMRSFSERPFTVKNYTPEMDHSLNITTGNRFNIGQSQLGYHLGFNYSKSYEQYDEREINTYSARIPDGTGTRMRPFQLNKGTESSDKVNNGFIGSLTYQINPMHEVTVTSIYNNSASESVLDMIDGEYPGALSAGTFNNRAISFKQRQLFNNQIKGRHLLDFVELRWSGNYIQSSQYEPDTRFVGSPVDANGVYFFVREVQLPFHFFRELSDQQYSAKVDAEVNLTNKFSLKTGGYFQYKDRVFDEFRYQLENNGTNPSLSEFLSFSEASGDFGRFFSPDNTGFLGLDSNGRPILGLTYRNQTRPENSYSGHEIVSAAYVMGVYELTNKIKLFGGLRVEHTDFSVISGSRSATIKEGVINVIDLLPSLNVIYSVTENANIRLSGSQTLARPNMREMAPFVSFDLLGGFPIVGNPEITRTNIINSDLRYELFPAPGELFAVSIFYKSFENPIVTELDVATDQPQYQFINTNSGRLYGFELEFRKKLDFISSRLQNMKFSTNFTYTRSRVDLSRSEFETRQSLDPNIKPYRPFPYQSPYILNVMLNYENIEWGIDAAVYANVFGPRLSSNGAGAAPDIFEIYGKPDQNGRIKSETPTPDLNIRIQKSFMNRFNASIAVSNILDYSVIQYQKDESVYFTNSSYNPGRTFKIGLSYQLY
jgi:outer membrane receptor for ferrienterochelin and colicin